MVNSEEFLLKLKSNIAPVATKDERALAALDAQIRAAQRAMAGLNEKSAASAAKLAEQQKAAKSASDAVRVALRNQQTGKGTTDEVRAAQAKAAQEGKLLASMRAKSLAAKQAADAGKKELDVLKAARPALAAQADAAKKAAESKKRWKEGVTQAGAAIHAIGGPMSTWLAKMQTIAPVAELGAASIISLGVVALSAVLVAGLAAAYAGLIQFALGAASARREAVLLGEAVAGVSRRPGQEFVAVVDQLARRVPIARDKLQEMAKEMALLKLGGRDLQAGLTATAMVTSALGESAGRNVRAIVEQSQAIRRFTLGARDIRGEFTALAGTGLTKADVIGALAKQLGKSASQVELMLLRGQIKLKDGLRALEGASKDRFGKIVGAQMLDFNVQISKAKEAFASLFNGLNLDPALNALKDFFDIFDEGNVTGKALKAIVTGGMQTLIDLIAKGLPIAKDFFGGMIDGALMLYIALAPTIYQIGKTISKWLGLSGSFDALKAGRVVLYTLAAAVAVVAVSLALAALPVVILGALIYGAVQLAIGALHRLKTIVSVVSAAFTLARDYIAALDWSELGATLIQGLIGGVSGMVGKFVDSIKSLARAGMNAFRSENEIQSPSKAYARYGRYIPQGAAMGVDDTAPLLGKSVTDMSTAAMPQMNVAAPMVSVTTPGGGGQQIVNNFYIDGAGKEPRSIAEEVISLMTGATMSSPAQAGAT